jgi:phosphate starvation-inducible membrane PsiE
MNNDRKDLTNKKVTIFLKMVDEQGLIFLGDLLKIYFLFSEARFIEGLAYLPMKSSNFQSIVGLINTYQ